MGKTRYLIYQSLLVTMALALSLIEKNIPTPFLTPGAKLGLANLVTLVAIYTMPKKKDILMIIIVRIVLVSLLGSSISGLMYGGMGAILSFGMMILLKDILKDKVSMIGISVTGAVFHNIGQLMVSICVVENIGAILYLPFLSIVGIVTGIFNGIVANYMIGYIEQLPMLKENTQIIHKHE